jgi:hypothetical protein
MHVFQHALSKENFDLSSFSTAFQPDFVMCFGERSLLTNGGYKAITAAFPNATIIGGSTAGEINNHSITDNSIVFTGVKLEKSTIYSALININEAENSFEAGKLLMNKLPKEGLKFVFVLSDGQFVNGSELVEGINHTFDDKIAVSGGLAGDGANFQQTVVGLNNDLQSGNIAAIGFYGDDLTFGFGSKGGWDNFGLTRIVTKSDKNILHEIDGESALDLYSRYLGDYAKELPGSALLFPLSITDDDGREVVRTVLSVDNEQKTMTFAGNIPEGSKVRLMKANLDQLVDAASDAVMESNELSLEHLDQQKLSILISCVGRKLIFGNRIEEEHDAARDVLGEKTTITGFYSYGEISPFSAFSKCELHNQTMTVTTIFEK